MRKRKKALSSLLFLNIFVLTSCQDNFSFNAYDFPSKEIINVKKEKETNIYYQKECNSSLNYINNNGEVESFSSLKDLYSLNESKKQLCLPSQGEVNLLVVPVSFSNSNKENKDRKKISIQNAFFGRSETTLFESVSSYYFKSSYGQLKIKGEVVDFVDIDYNYNDLEKNFGMYTNASRQVTNLVVKSLFEKYGKEYLSQFDLDNNGYLDSIYLIYDAPVTKKENSLFWAYCDYVVKPDKSISILANNYAWVGLDFILSKNFKSIDTHTIIHETGHLFGLSDYYNSFSNAKTEPTRYMDMMDYNIGDHTAGSKLALNWINPKVVIGDGDIELKPFYNSGDAILIPSSSYSNNQFNEFLLLEYYAPEGMNQKELKFTFSYTDNNGQEQLFNYLSYYGIKLYYVNFSLAYFEDKTGNFICDLNDESASTLLKNKRDLGVKYSLKYKYSNSILNDSSPSLYKIIGKNDEKNVDSSKPFDNKSLFIKGDSFGINSFVNYSFNDGEKIPFSFEIKQFSTSRAIISFKRNE